MEEGEEGRGKCLIGGVEGGEWVSERRAGGPLECILILTRGKIGMDWFYSGKYTLLDYMK